MLKGVLSSYKSATSILPNNPMMLPPFFVFMNFHPKLSGSCSGLIIRLELSQWCNENGHCVVNFILDIFQQPFL